MIPVVSFVGKSKIGKTTLLVEVIAKLKQRGYRLAVAKHVEEFELDKEGKDSWKFAQAGADGVIVSGAGRIAEIQSTGHDLSLEEVYRHVSGDFDIFLTEGFKKGHAPKIELHRKARGKDLFFSPPELVALVTDEPLEPSVPQFSWEDIDGIADFVEQKFIKPRRVPDVSVFVNSVEIPTNEFVHQFIAGTLEGMMSSLRGGKNIKTLDIRLRKT